MKLPKFLLIAGLLASPLLAQAHEYDAGKIHIDHPWSREMPPSAPNAAAYFVLHNKGNSADRLTSASTPVAEKAELHQHIHQDGLMKMQQVQTVDVPAGGEVQFAPMGYHVMLFGLKQQLKDGERFPLTLHFDKAGDVQVEVAVQKDAPAAEHQH
ncbi:copper chaperone PCu(A)C [Pseudomonas sp. BMS12]|uniref:copper chaperone PCu(A)C n=1 Tax=Pseudomonas sp. BMS12 TaxID=1796033 RepID=UPI00083B2E67|nr:copper chaperone PCu(A)C [Pseudomonas sp. BMS12]